MSKFFIERPVLANVIAGRIANRFDLVVTLSSDAADAVKTRSLEAGAIEHWPMSDPTEMEGNREAVREHCG